MDRSSDLRSGLKVEKGLEKQALILGFRMKYLAIFAALVLLCLFPLMQGVSFNTVVFSLVSCGACFVATKTADERNLLEKIRPVRFPNILVNDLYKKLNDGTDTTK